MPAFVGICRVTLALPGSLSLKDKRRVIRSLLERLRRRYALSAAEVGDQDVLRRAQIAFACVSGEHHHCEAVLAESLRWLESHPEVELVTVETEIV